MTDSRNNATTTAYNSMGQIGSVTDAAGKTVTYDYYPIASTMAGRLKSITNALSRHNTIEYNDRGEQIRTWGETAYPVEHIFDDYGRKVEMRTFRDGSNWANSAWSIASSGARRMQPHG